MFDIIPVEFLIFLGSVFLGVVCSFFLNRYFVAKKENKIKLSNDVKSELDNLYFEKSVELEAMNKINQYFGEKKIDELEKDMLLLKYAKLLNHSNERIISLQPVLGAREIFEFRKQLYSLISNSIAKLDERLSDLSNNFNSKEEGDAKKLAPVSEPMTAEMRTTSKPDIINNGNVSPLPFAKSKNDGDLLGVDRNSITTPPSYFNKDTFDKKNENNDDNEPSMAGTKKENFEDVNTEEIDKIQKDVLNILKRLESHDDQM